MHVVFILDKVFAYIRCNIAAFNESEEGIEKRYSIVK